jgi:hypothetical protein
MNRRRDDAGPRDGVSEVKECIGAAIKATIEGETETTQDIELIRGFHSEAFCYRGSPEATRCGCFLPVQLKHNSLLKKSLSVQSVVRNTQEPRPKHYKTVDLNP